MPDLTPIVHFRNEHAPLRAAVCGELFGIRASDPGRVTCFACRKDPQFIRAQDETPVKLSGVMAEDPYLRALANKSRAMVPPEGIPQYVHDCSDCEYLGSTLQSTGYNVEDRVELYYCHAPEEGNVLARFSNEPMNYVSGLAAAQHDPNLALAVVRAIHKGLFKANALHFL